MINNARYRCQYGYTNSYANYLCPSLHWAPVPNWRRPGSSAGARALKFFLIIIVHSHLNLSCASSQAHEASLLHLRWPCFEVLKCHFRDCYHFEGNLAMSNCTLIILLVAQEALVVVSVLSLFSCSSSLLGPRRAAWKCLEAEGGPKMGSCCSGSRHLVVTARAVSIARLWACAFSVLFLLYWEGSEPISPICGQDKCDFWYEIQVSLYSATSWILVLKF